MVRCPSRGTGQVNPSFAGETLEPFSKSLASSSMEERLIDASVWKGCSANYFTSLGLSAKAIRTPKIYRN